MLHMFFLARYRHCRTPHMTTRHGGETPRHANAYRPLSSTCKVYQYTTDSAGNRAESPIPKCVLPWNETRWLLAHPYSGLQSFTKPMSVLNQAMRLCSLLLDELSACSRQCEAPLL